MDTFRFQGYARRRGNMLMIANAMSKQAPKPHSRILGLGLSLHQVRRMTWGTTVYGKELMLSVGLGNFITSG